jgi:hypothetical protein
LRITAPLPSGILQPSAKAVCSSKSATVSAFISNSTGPWKYQWKVNGNPFGTDTSSGIRIVNLLTPQSITLSSIDAHGCKIDFNQVLIDTFPRPIMKWTGEGLKEQCRNNPAFLLDDALILPEKSLRKAGSFNIYGNSLALGYRGLVDSISPTSFSLNPSKLDNTLLQHGKIHSEIITAYFKDSNGCEVTADITQTIQGNPEFALIPKTYCQNAHVAVSTDSFISAVNNDTFKYNWQCISAPVGINSSSVIQAGQLGESKFYFGAKGNNANAGIYNIQSCLTNKFSGCNACQNTTVKLLPQPELSLTPRPEFCSSDGLYNLENTFLSNGNKPLIQNTSYMVFSLDGDTSKMAMQGAAIISGQFFKKNNLPGFWKIKTRYSESGCQTQIDVTLQILPAPLAQFITDKGDTTPISNPTFNITNQSTISPATALDYFWNFDMRFPEVVNSIEIKPKITYPMNDEVYKVRLIARSKNNCHDTFFKTLVVGSGSAGVNHQYIDPYSLDNQFVYNGKAEFVSIEIYELSGKKVLYSDANKGIALKPGIYTYQITLSQNGILRTARGKKQIFAD